MELLRLVVRPLRNLPPCCWKALGCWRLWVSRLNTSRLNICVAPQQNNYRLFQQQILGMGLDSLYFGALSTHHLPSMSRFGEVDWTRGEGQRFHRLG